MEDNKTNDIVSVINILRTKNFYGAGKYTEIAKGKHKVVSDWKGFSTKIKRLIKASKKR